LQRPSTQLDSVRSRGLAFTGLRLGELVGLLWEDVDAERGLTTVPRPLSPNGSGRLEPRATKSGRVRDVPTIDDLAPWLNAAPDTEFPNVFRGIRGGPFDSGNLARAVKWFEARDRIATFHDGRPLVYRAFYCVGVSRNPGSPFLLGLFPMSAEAIPG
jgi:integrase